MPGHGLDPLDGTHKPIDWTQVMPLRCQEAATIKARSTMTSQGSASLLLSSFLGRRLAQTPACDSGCLALFGSLILYMRRLSSKSAAPVQSSQVHSRTVANIRLNSSSSLPCLQSPFYMSIITTNLINQLNQSTATNSRNDTQTCPVV